MGQQLSGFANSYGDGTCETIDMIQQFIQSGSQLHQAQQSGRKVIKISGQQNRKQQRKQNQKEHQRKNYRLIYNFNLQEATIHENTYLDVSIFLPPMFFSSVQFIVFDQKNGLNRVAIYDYEGDYLNDFQIGTRIRIYNPFYKHALDRLPLVKVEDPSEIEFVKPNYVLFIEQMADVITSVDTKNRNMALKIFQTFKIVPHLKNELGFKEAVEFLDDHFKKPQSKKQSVFNSPYLKTISYDIPVEESDESDEEEQFQGNQHFSQQSPFQQQNQSCHQWQNHYTRVDDIMNSTMDNIIDPFQMIEINELVKQDPTYLITTMQSINASPLEHLRLYESRLRKFPNYAFLWYNYGENAFIVGDYQLTVKAMVKFLEIHTSKGFGNSSLYSFAHYQLGQSLKFLSNYQEALIYLKKASQLEPNSLVFLQALSKYFLEVLNFVESEKYSNQVIQKFKASKQSKKSDDFVEYQRCIDNQLQISLINKNPEQVFYYSNELCNANYENFNYVINLIKNYAIHPEIPLSNKLVLCDLMKKSENFSVVQEEILVLSFLIEQNSEVKQQYLVNYQKTLQLKSEGEQKKDEKLDEGEEKDENEDEDEQEKENEKEKAKEKENDLEDSKNKQKKEQIEEVQEERKDIQLVLEKKTKIEDIDSQLLSKITTEWSKEKVFNSIRNKKQNFDEFQKETQIKQKRYKGYVTEVDENNHIYIICFNIREYIEEIKYKKFKQAAEKFARSDIGSTGIKRIKINEQQYSYEIKIMGQGERLLCNQPMKEDKNRTILDFNVYGSHKKTEKQLKKQRKNKKRKR